MESIIKLFPFFTPESHYATKPYLYACLCSNYAFLCIIRACADPLWIYGPAIPSSTPIPSSINATAPWVNSTIPDTTTTGSGAGQVYLGRREILLLSLAGGCSLVNQICIRVRAAGVHLKFSTQIACISTFIQTIMLISISVVFSNNYAWSAYYYTSGYAACFSASIASSFALVCFMSDVFYFSKITSEQSLEQKKYEFANFLFIMYILFGATSFCFLETWVFEKSAEFCLMTLLTIGYGNIVPVTFWGRFFMMVYTSIGLCFAGFLIIAVEDVIIQDTEMPNLRRNDSIMSFQQMNGSMSLGGGGGNATMTDLESGSEPLDPDLINQLPILPLTQTMTNASIVSRNSILSRDSDYPYRDREEPEFWSGIFSVFRVVVWVLGWWLGAGAVFAYFEGWTFMNGVYFAFVSMTGIGYGDFTLGSPPAVEFWWVFLFNAISIIAFFISFAGKTLAKKVAKDQLQVQRRRLVRRLKRKRISIRNVEVVDGSVITSPMSQVTPHPLFHEPEFMAEYQAGNTLTRRYKAQTLQRVGSSPRLQSIFVMGSNNNSDNPATPNSAAPKSANSAAAPSPVTAPNLPAPATSVDASSFDVSK